MNIRYLLFLMLLGPFFLTSLSAEQVGKLSYKGIPEDIDGLTIEIPFGVVHMSEKVHVGQLTEIIEGTVDTTSPPAIFFLIDHSGSMFLKDFQQNGSTQQARDRWGARFKVTSDLLDTIREIYPESEVGLAVFRSNLYFNPIDDNLFSAVSENNGEYYGGGYIPLMKLKDEYIYLNGASTSSGYNILKQYLDTTMSTVPNTADEYVNLAYAPSDSSLEPWGTNITAGIDAVKDAFKNSSVPKDRQYVIFLSDGDATEPTHDPAEMMRFLEGEDIPTLFTVFFSPDGSIPQNIDSLTTVVKNNSYSSSNVQSAAWSINADYKTLMSMLIDNVFSIINSKSVAKPIDVTVNGKKPDGDPVEIGGEFIYTFSSTFPFTGVENDFTYEINYIVNIQDIVNTVQKDTTITSEFTIAITNSDKLPEEFELSFWDRKIEFYYNGTLIEKADETMDSIEVRFVSSEVDTIYTYSDVKLNLTNSNPSDSGKEDFETVTLAEADSFFSVTVAIPIAEANPGDNALQINNVDEIIAIFRNPALPLDTLRDTLPFQIPIAIGAEKPSTINTLSMMMFGSRLNYSIPQILSGFDLTIDLFDLSGRHLFSLKRNEIKSGAYTLDLSTGRASLATGCYIAKMSCGESVHRSRILLRR